MLLAVGAAIFYLLFLGDRDLWNPNEPIYGTAVAEMAASGDWLIPTIDGQIFAEKPPLYFWLALTSSRLLGNVTEFTLRVPSSLAGIAGVLLVYLLVLPYSNRLRARLAAVVFGTTYIVVWSARSIQMDLLLTTCCLATILAVVRVLDDDARLRRAGWALAGVAAGLGFLTKGPVGIIIPGVVLFLYLVATNRLSKLTIKNLATCAAAFLLITLPWVLVLLSRGETALLHEVFYRQNVLRVAAPWDHQAPWWYYLREFWNDMAPWSFFVPLALVMPGRDADERKLDRLALVWIVGVVLFFSLSPSKRSPYILPLAPAVAILVAGLLERWITGRLAGWRAHATRGLHGVIGVVLSLAGIVMMREVTPAYPALAGVAGALAVTLIVGGLLVLAAAVAGSRLRLAVPVSLLGVLVVVFLQVAGWALPAVDAYKSARPFCQQVDTQLANGGQLAAYGLWKWRAGYSFYLEGSLKRLVTSAELAEFWQGPGERLLIVEQGMLEKTRQIIGPIEPVLSRKIGSNHAYLFSNRSAPAGI
jgi:4-amino-4-deoxy-L-arabinose transferase-like glycosyltransferase